MSVITSYDIRSEKDMVSKLESIGALKKGKSFEIINYVPDENGYCHEEGTKTCYCATLDFSKLWTEDWAKYSEDIKKHGAIAELLVDLHHLEFHGLAYELIVVAYGVNVDL